MRPGFKRSHLILSCLLTSALCLSCLTMVSGQEEIVKSKGDFRNPQRRSSNLLETNGPYLKTIYGFEPSYYDTLPQPGPDPLLVARYEDKAIIPLVFDAVFSNRVSVYNPNFWGSVPQLLAKSKYEKFDTTNILEYLAAGWDTSLMIDNNGKMESIPEYRKIPYNEVSGIFFFESWWLDQKNNKLYKDIAAYLPIREYISSVFEGYDNTEIRRRLLFMVIPEWSTGSKQAVKYKAKDFLLINKNIRYEVPLYNKEYNMYLFREEYQQISDAEFNNWQFHYFDFYRYFDANLFLERLITGILEGKLYAFLPGVSKNPLQVNEFIKLLQSDPEQEGIIGMGDPIESLGGSDGKGYGLLPEDYPLYELNSIEFQEDWYINPGNLQIYKDVKSITINRTETRFDNYTGDYLQESVRPLFTVRF